MTGQNARPRPDWIAVDWGTSALRAHAVIGAEAHPLGVLPKGMGVLGDPAAFEAVLLDLFAAQDRFDLTPPLQVIACGAVGARQGWVEVPYRQVPCAPLVAGPTPAPTRTPGLDVRIVPGLAQSDPPDVMRGEETQIAGFLARNPGWDGVLVLPGTHSKWVAVSAGEITGFRTAMTGELFATLIGATTLRHAIPAFPADAVETDAYRAAFLDGVDEAMTAPDQLIVALFSVRARALLRDTGPVASAARLSGLLIGAEIAALRGWWLGNRIGLISSGHLGDSYDIAMRRQGITPERAASGTATLTGLALAKGLT